MGIAAGHEMGPAALRLAIVRRKQSAMTARIKTRSSGRLLPLVLPGAVSKILKSAINERFDGKVARAANRSGIPRSWLRRMIGPAVGRPRAIQQTVIPKLMKLVGLENESVLRRAIFPDDVQALVERHKAWLKHKRRTASLGTGAWWEFTGRRVMRGRNRVGSEGITRRDRERAMLVAHLKRRHPRLMERLNNLVYVNFQMGRATLLQ